MASLKMADLEKAIEAARKAVLWTPKDHCDLPGRLNDLGCFLGLRYEQTEDINNLEEGIEVTQQAVLLAQDHFYRAVYLDSLGNMLQYRYERFLDKADLEKAIQAAREAIASTPEEHQSYLAGFLHNLGNKLCRRYERTRCIGDLEEAIQASRKAVAATSKDYHNRWNRLNTLGNALYRQYKQTGDTSKLKEAIQVAREAVASTPENHPGVALCLTNLGDKLGGQYEQTGNMASLEEAIQVSQQAIAATSKDDSNLPVYFNNLSNMLNYRYQRLGEIADLEETIQVTQQAVDVTPKTHPNQATYLCNLGNALGRQFERTADVSKLEKAIETTQEAVKLMPQGHVQLTPILNNLGTMLYRQYKLASTRDIAILNKAIEVALEAVESTANDHSDLAMYLNNLGNMLEIRYNRTKNMTDMAEANSVFSRSWASDTSAPFSRIYAASRCLRLMFRLGKYDEAADLAISVTNFLPIVNTRSLDRNDKQYVVSRFAGIAADACAVLLQARGPETALQNLEKGRAVILGQMIDNWSDLSTLKVTHPELATRFETLRDIVNARSNPMRDESDPFLTSRRRRAAALELQLCIQSIQDIPGQELFMAAQSNEVMQACAAGGNIVIVNVSSLRSDAIIVSLTGIRTIRLLSLSAADAEIWIRKKWHGPKSEQKRRNEEYAEFLEWLWEVCVRHILEACVCTNSGPASSRIWWIGIGLASSMPFHAAGDHSPDSTKNTFNRVISSYSPSIKILSYSRSRRSIDMDSKVKTLIATMPVTPGWASLPGAILEKTRIMETIQHYASVQYLEHPSAEAVMHSMKECKIAHFACHGGVNHVDPSSSGLILQRKDECGNIEQDVLTVHDLSKMNLQHAQLAYLSACSTAENKATPLADEAIHVVSGFQVAGFPHVIGCLWRSNNRVCIDVAHGFYASLVKQEALLLNSTDIAAALHTSLMKLRLKEWRMPLLWAQFVHYGA